MANWPPRDGQSRLVSAVGTWFSPARWSPNDMIIAVAGLVLAVSLFLPWFKATVKTRDPSVSGFLIDPPGTVNGIAVHRYLWVVLALALLEFAVLAVRYIPARRAFRLPGYRQFLVVASGLSCAVVLAGAVMKPGPWFGNLELEPGLSLVIDWDFGAFAALGAAIVSLGIAIAAMRDHPRR